jgi:hypothetical protein
MRTKTLIITIIFFLLYLSYIIVNEYYLGPAKIPGAQPLNINEIIDNLWSYIILALSVTIIFYFGYRADKKK